MCFHDDYSLGIFVDGAWFGEAVSSYTDVVDASTSFVIGGGVQQNDYWFDGNIDEVIVFNASLTEQEIKEMYVRGRAKFLYSEWQTSDYFNVDAGSTNFKVDYRFNAGNVTSPFYTPILKTSTASPVTTQTTTNFTNCTELTFSNAEYTLMNDISRSDLGDDCVIVEGGNITVSTGSYSVSTNSPFTGIYSNEEYTSVISSSGSISIPHSGGFGLEIDGSNLIFSKS